MWHVKISTFLCHPSLKYLEMFHHELLLQLWIWWFGNHTYSQVSENTLKNLTEGLEAHHTERQKLRK